LNDLVGGYHFGFEDVGAGPFADSGSMPRATELGYARSFTVEWLNLYMKGDQSAWRQLWGPEAAQDPQVQYSVNSGIAVTSTTTQLSGNGGALLDYSINVKNNGTYATSFSLFAEDNSWNTSFSTLQTPVLNVGGSTTLHVFVTVPPGSLVGASDNVLISARNDTDDGTRGYVRLQSIALGDSPPTVDLNGAAGGADYTSTPLIHPCFASECKTSRASRCFMGVETHSMSQQEITRWVNRKDGYSSRVLTGLSR
jgi:hypothetical protein